MKRNDVVPNSYIVKLKENAALTINERDVDHHARFRVSPQLNSLFRGPLLHLLVLIANFDI